MSRFTVPWEAMPLREDEQHGGLLSVVHTEHGERQRAAPGLGNIVRLDLSWRADPPSKKRLDSSLGLLR